MATDLPEYVDARRLAEQGKPVRGRVSPDKLSRLGDPYRAKRAVDVDLMFEIDDDRIRVRGSIKTELEAICQRCLEWMRIDMAQNIDGLIVTEQVAAAFEDNERQDFLIADDERLRLASYVEEEILLAMPMVPMHDEGVCGPPGNGAPIAIAGRKKPFADLAELMKDKDAK